MMKKVLLLSVILIFSLSFVLPAAEKPQTVLEKGTVDGKKTSENLSYQGLTKDFGLFKGRITTALSTEDSAFYEDFETWPPVNMTLNPASGDGVWEQSDGSIHGPGAGNIPQGTYGAYFNDYDYSAGVSGEMISKMIDLSSAAYPRLQFWYWDGGGSDVVEVFASNDSSNWTLIYTTPGTVDPWEEMTVSLTSYAGSATFWFKFVGTSVWGLSNPYMDAVTISETPAVPVMVTLYSELTAPPTPVGTTVSDSFGIVTNAGGATLTISSISLTNSDFAMSPTSGTLDPGDTLFVEGSFTPSTVGPISGLIIIQGDDPDNPADTIQVSGEGYPADYVLEEFNDWPFYPYNFTRINANDDDYQWGWFQYVFAPGDTTLCAGIRWAADGNDDYLVTPPIPVESGDYISFESWVGLSSYPETWQVLVSTTDMATASFTVGLDTVTSNSTTPIVYTYDLSAFAGQTIYLAIRNVSVDKYYQFVDNVLMPRPDYPVFINEVYYDGPGTDTGMFTELFGMPGMNLDGYSLIGINGNGGAVYATININAMSIPESGFFVIGQDNTVPNVNLIASAADWQNGPDNVSLMNGADTVDAMGYGDFSSAVFTGRGNPAVDVFSGISLSRYPDGMNTNDNAADFHATYPTPGIDNDPPEAIIGGSTSTLSFGTVTVGSDSSRDYTIFNNGSADLVVDTIAASSLVFTSTLPDTINPGGSAVVTVTFAPTQGITYADTLIIYSNDPVNGERGIPLSGTGELSAQNAEVILAAQIGGDSQYRSFWVNGSWDSSGVYNSNWTGPMVELNDKGVAPDAVAGDHIFTGSVILAIDNTNTYQWWTGSENDANSFLENGVGLVILSSGTVTPDTLIVDGDGGINDWVISLAGDFNGWNNSANDMIRNGTVWSTTVALDTGYQEYKYTVMHQWNAAYGSGGVGGAGVNYSFIAPDSGLYLFSFDDADNSQTITQPPLFFDDFESGVGNWVLEGTWGLTDLQSHSPTHSLTESPAGNYGSNLEINAIMANGVDLSTALDATVSFWARYNIEQGFDYMYVDATSDDNTWVRLATFDGEGFNTWEQYSFSLGGLVGNPDVKVRFHFSSDGSYEVDGMYIDDFMITSSDVDNSPPLIVHTGPVFYEGTLGNFVVDAEITDISGIESALVLYTLDGGSINSLTPDSTFGSMYYFTIPMQSAGVNVDYWITAIDSASNIDTMGVYQYSAGNQLIYDNGVVSFYIIFNANQGSSVRMSIPTGKQADLTTLLIRNYTDVNNQNDSMLVHVWVDNNGSPGSDLITPFMVYPEATLMNTSPMTRVDLRPYAAQLSGLTGDLFIGFTVPAGSVNGVRITETSPGLFGRSFAFNGTAWAPDGADFHMRAVIGDTTTVGITGVGSQIPTEFSLYQNYPNPFNPTTTIKYGLKENTNVVLKIYNLLGQEVRTLVNARQEAGFKSVVWNGLNNYGNRVASGIYIYQIKAGDFVKARKMILMK